MYIAEEPDAQSAYMMTSDVLVAEYTQVEGAGMEAPSGSFAAGERTTKADAGYYEQGDDFYVYQYDLELVVGNPPAVNHAPVIKSGVTNPATAETAVGTAWELDLTTIFEDPDGDQLTYKVSVDSAEAVAADAVYAYTPSEAGKTMTLAFTANDGKVDSTDVYTVTLTATEQAAVTWPQLTSLTVNSDPAKAVLRKMSGTGTLAVTGATYENYASWVDAGYDPELGADTRILGKITIYIAEEPDAQSAYMMSGDVLVAEYTQVEGAGMEAPNGSFEAGERTTKAYAGYYEQGDDFYVYQYDLELVVGNPPAGNQAPVIKSGVINPATAETAVGTAWELDLTTIFEDPDGDPLTYKVSVGGAEAVAADANYTYTPSAAGETTLAFTANDGEADSAVYTVTLTAGQAAATWPQLTELTVASDAKLFHQISGSIPINSAVFENYDEPKDAGDARSYEHENLPHLILGKITLHVESALQSNGWYNLPQGKLRSTYENVGGAHMEESISGRFDSGSTTMLGFAGFDSTWATVYAYEVEAVVDAPGVNQAPVIRSGVTNPATAETEVGTAWELDLTTIFADPDGDPLTYKVSVDGAEAVAADANYAYTPTAEGETTLAFTANDGEADSAVYTVTLTATGQAVVLDDYDITAILGKVAAYEKKTVTNPTVASVGGEWTVLGLMRSGRGNNAYIAKYYANLLAVLRQYNGKLGRNTLPTDYERVSLALTSTGCDAMDFYGYNLLLPLADADFVTSQTINAAIFGLIAFDAHAYEIPPTTGNSQTTREKLIINILDREIAGGGWSLNGKAPADVDITAMAIQSLAPYYHSNAGVKAAADRAVAWLASQCFEGGFSSWGTSNSESIAQVIVALTALGIDPATDHRFCDAQGRNPVSALLGFLYDGETNTMVTSGEAAEASASLGFAHVKSGQGSGLNAMATDQAFYALAAYERFRQGRNSLYNMADTPLSFSAEQTPPELAGDASSRVSKVLGEIYELNVASLFHDANLDALTYWMSEDGSAFTQMSGEVFTYTSTVEVEKVFRFKAKDKEAYSPEYTLTLSFAADPTLDLLEWKVNNTNTVTITKCDTSVMEMVIPAQIEGRPVAVIGKGAFNNADGPCDKLTKLVLPDSLTTIESGAFTGCSALANVKLSKNLKMIGDTAFLNCASLTSLTLPDSVTFIGDRAFQGTGLSQLTLPKSLETLGARVFHGTNILSLELPAALKNVGALTFVGILHNTLNLTLDTGNPYLTIKDSVLYNKDMTKLIVAFGSVAQHFTVPDSVVDLGDYAFFNVQIRSFTFGANVRTIGNYVFAGQTSDGYSNSTLPAATNTLSSVTFNAKLETLGNGAFAGTSITSAVLPASLMSMAPKAFDCPELMSLDLSATQLTEVSAIGGEKLETLKLPKGLKVLGSIVCSPRLNELILPFGLQTITTGAFRCLSDMTVTIPRTVTYMNGTAFGQSGSDCENLKIYFEGAVPEYPTGQGSYGLFGGLHISKVDTISIYYLEGMEGWSPDFMDKVSSGSSSWDFKVVDHVYHPQTYSLEAPRIVFGDGALKRYLVAGDTYTIKYVTTETTVDWHSSNPAAASVENGVVTAKEPGISVITATVTKDGKTSSEQLTIEVLSVEDAKWSFTENDDGTLTITGYADANVTELTVPAELGSRKVRAVGSNAFMKQANTLKKLIFSEGISEIGAYLTGYEMSALEEVSLPGTLKKISASFYKTRLQSVVIPDGVASIGDNVFMGCEDLKHVTLPKGLTELGMNVFSGCTSLAEIELPDGLQKIGINCFEKCTALKRVYIPAATEDIGGVPGPFAGSGLEAMFMRRMPAVCEIIDLQEMGAPDLIVYHPDDGMNWAGLGTYNNAVWNLEAYIAAAENLNYEADDAITAALAAAVNVSADEGASPVMRDDALVALVKALYAAKHPAYLKSLEVMPPAMTSYEEGDLLDLTGFKLTAVFSDGTRAELTADKYKVSGYDKDKLGRQTITVSAYGKTADFDVNVEQGVFLRGLLITPPDKVVYEIGEALDLTGFQLAAVYSDGEEADVTNDAVLTGYDKNKLGWQNITAAYGGKTVSFTVQVIEEKAVTEVIDLINAIGTVGRDSGPAIEAARTAYDRLTAEQKAKIANYAALAAAEAQYAHVEKALEVEKRIASIGKVTKASKGKIDAARNAYDALTAEEKALVTNYAVLTAAERAYASLKKAGGDTKVLPDDKGGKKDGGDGTDPGTTDPGEDNPTPDEPDLKDGQVSVTIGGVTYVVDEAAGAVMEKIAELMKADKPDENAVAELYRAYEALTDAQKAQVKAANYADLEALMNKVGTANHADEKTGVRAENLPWYIKIVVEQKEPSTDIYKTLQGQLGGNKLLVMWDISLMNLLTGEKYEPTETVRVRVPAPDASGYDGVVMAHYTEDGRLEYIEAEAVDGELVFDAISFSLYGVVGYVGQSPLELTDDTKPSGEPVEETPWLWIVIGALGAAGIAALAFVIIRKQKKAGPEEKTD